MVQEGVSCLEVPEHKSVQYISFFSAHYQHVAQFYIYNAQVPRAMIKK